MLTSYSPLMIFKKNYMQPNMLHEFSALLRVVSFGDLLRMVRLDNLLTLVW